MITIYHNPRCSKSRETLALVQQLAEAQELRFEVVDYQETPLTAEKLSALQKKLGVALRTMVRENEEEYATLGLAAADEAALLQALVHHPKLLQRPIVVANDRAIFGRPPERVHDLFEQLPGK